MLYFLDWSSPLFGSPGVSENLSLSSQLSRKLLRCLAEYMNLQLRLRRRRHPVVTKTPIFFLVQQANGKASRVHSISQILINVELYPFSPSITSEVRELRK